MIQDPIGYHVACCVVTVAICATFAWGMWLMYIGTRPHD